MKKKVKEQGEVKKMTETYEETYEPTEEKEAINLKVKTKRPRKISKDVTSKPGVVIFEVVGGVNGPMEFNVNELSDAVKEQLIPFGLSHKLGDAAAGKHGVEAETAITRVWEEMLKGNWSTRVAATKSFSKKVFSDKLKNLSKETLENARKIFAELGLEHMLPSDE
jgi:hypothetical protein